MPVPQQAQHLLQQQLLQGCSKPSFLGYPDPRPPVQPASFSRTLLGKGPAGGSAWAAADFCVDSRAAGGGDEASETPVIDDAVADAAGVERDGVSPAPRAAPCAAARPERGTRGAGHQWSPRTKPAMPQPVTPAKILREVVHDSQAPPAHPFKQRSTRYVARGRVANFEQAPAARRRAKPRPGTPANDGGTAPAPTRPTPTPPPLT
eukprot:Rhum_TRINITY_DN2670_c0_g1::Rhum_TRINITY_DN2670_c0_g1_i1::g.7894::m.7894